MRFDTIDPSGKLTIRYAGKLRHLGVGRTDVETPIALLTADAEEVRADAEVKKAEAERDAVKARNDAKEELRD